MFNVHAIKCKNFNLTIQKYVLLENIKSKHKLEL